MEFDVYLYTFGYDLKGMAIFLWVVECVLWVLAKAQRAANFFVN